MKPIDQMTLTEVLGHLRFSNFYDELSVENTCNMQADVADRIHDLTRWIPVSERMPTEEDAHNGQVLVKEENWTTDHAYSIAYYKNIEPDVPERQPSEWYVTYWKRITPPEGKP
jgi:hypothetical protein